MRQLEDINGSLNNSPEQCRADCIPQLVKSDTFQAVADYFQAYPEDSLLSGEARAFLYQMIREFRPEKVLEIGTYLAGTTEVLARALWANGRGRLATIDLFETGNVGERVAKWPRELRDITSFHHLTSMRYFSNSDNEPHLREQGFFTDLDLVFIDGNHDYGYAFFDLNLAAQHVNPGGIIVLDNYYLPGVFWATKHFLSLNPGWREIGDSIKNHDPADPFNTIQPSLIQQIVLTGPEHFCIGDRPTIFDFYPLQANGISGFQFTCLPDNQGGTLHLLIHFWSFFNDKSLGFPEETTLVKKIKIAPDETTARLDFPALATSRDPAISSRRADVCLVWQPGVPGTPLRLTEKPTLILVDGEPSDSP